VLFDDDDDDDDEALFQVASARIGVLYVQFPNSVVNRVQVRTFG